MTRVLAVKVDSWRLTEEDGVCHLVCGEESNDRVRLPIATATLASLMSQPQRDAFLDALVAVYGNAYMVGLYTAYNEARKARALG